MFSRNNEGYYCLLYDQNRINAAKFSSQSQQISSLPSFGFVNLVGVINYADAFHGPFYVGQVVAVVGEDHLLDWAK